MSRHERVENTCLIAPSPNMKLSYIISLPAALSKSKAEVWKVLSDRTYRQFSDCPKVGRRRQCKAKIRHWLSTEMLETCLRKIEGGLLFKTNST